MAERDDAQIAALMRERTQVEPSGDVDRLKAIDEQLKLYGYEEAAEKRRTAADGDDSDKARRTAPQGRSTQGKQTS